MADKYKLPLWQDIRDYVLIEIGLMLYAIGFVCFIIPYQLMTGGVSGAALLVYYATGIEVQWTYFSINILLMAVALKLLGWKFCKRTLVAIVSLTFFLDILQEYFVDASGSPLRLVGDERFMAAVIGAIFEGGALGICFSVGGSTGGTDIIAAIINKYKNMTIGRAMLCADILIISSSYLVSHDYEMVIFGLSVLIMSSVVVDYVNNSVQRSVQFLIVSKKSNEIADAINEELHRGVTELLGRGHYLKEDTNVLLVMAKKRESVALFRLVKAIDPRAFVSMSKVVGVYGEGFDKLTQQK